MGNLTSKNFGESSLKKLLQLIEGMFVKKETGKGLSANDFTNDLKTKLDGIEAGAQVNAPVDAALSDESENAVQNKAVKAAIDLKAPLASPALTGAPTAPTATAGTNNTQIATTAFVVSAILAAIGEISGISIQAVESFEALPETGEVGVIYLVPNEGSAPNIKDEYFWTGESYELYGTTKIDLTNYVEYDDIVEMTDDEVLAVWNQVFAA